MTLSSTIQWIAAIEFQGLRLLKINKINSSLHSINRKLSNQQRVEEHFFIISVNKAIEWLEQTVKIYPQFSDCLKKFENELPNIKELRNMREHDIEYLSWNWRKQENFHKKVEDVSLSISADATSAIIFPDKYLIGWRLNVQKTIALSIKILPDIYSFFQNQLN